MSWSAWFHHHHSGQDTAWVVVVFVELDLHPKCNFLVALLGLFLGGLGRDCDRFHVGAERHGSWRRQGSLGCVFTRVQLVDTLALDALRDGGVRGGDAGHDGVPVRVLLGQVLLAVDVHAPRPVNDKLQFMLSGRKFDHGHPRRAEDAVADRDQRCHFVEVPVVERPHHGDLVRLVAFPGACEPHHAWVPCLGRRARRLRLLVAAYGGVLQREGTVTHDGGRLVGTGVDWSEQLDDASVAVPEREVPRGTAVVLHGVDLDRIEGQEQLGQRDHAHRRRNVEGSRPAPWCG
mmetsp:Transcript_114956/g.199959  ORF Transcript_114956/g.199959 Transcript_114956/m.199959 type:complete len:290 (-) Transcript_114956:2365-3234(-)